MCIRDRVHSARVAAALALFGECAHSWTPERAEFGCLPGSECRECGLWNMDPGGEFQNCPHCGQSVGDCPGGGFEGCPHRPAESAHKLACRTHRYHLRERKSSGP
eukprot:TRINITY_DN26418_c0_g1_i1.p2 TRINITY_DN26418_c0_g1~~TRINITY_DN26418_c0_g1_i1.p2  ORF type:complete len:105 (+),score=9.24 TRINITY_DN26418_c0_g1_i1:131-445(+)